MRIVATFMPAMALLLALGQAGFAADGDTPPAPATPGTPATPAAPGTPAKPTPDPEDSEGDSKWVMQPTPNRIDVFFDEEALDTAMHKNEGSHEVAPGKEPGAGGAQNPAVVDDNYKQYYQQQIDRIDAAINERKWDEAGRFCEEAIKKLSGYPVTPDITNELNVLHGYSDQVQDALERDKAEANFDALHLKINGILWSQDGPRLVLIDGETRPLGLNDRVKDCTIINIDTDRVDFRFHYNRKRFEFPRYVGEDTNHK